MNLLESFFALFDSANMLTVCLWITGFALFAVEFFQPMKGVAYALGLPLILAAFVTHMLHGSPGEAFMFVFFTTLMLFAVHSVSLATHKRDWLNVARMERADERTHRYGALIDSVGVANTPIDYTGNVTVNDINLMVYSETPIAPGCKVRIVDVTADKILVEPVTTTVDNK